MSSVLLLGAASDIACSLARKFASCGYSIQLAGRNASRFEPLQSDIAIRYNVPCTLHEFDAARPETHAHFFSSLPDHPGICISIFGYLGNQQLAETSWEECNHIISVNYTGAVSILNIVANDYAAAGSGTIVGISSVAGERGRGSNYYYGSAKAGFTAYLSGLRNRMFEHGVHVLTVKPGFVETKMTEDLTLPPILTAQPDEVASAIFNAVKAKNNVLYVKWFWRWIMFLIKCIPESQFKKMKL